MSVGKGRRAKSYFFVAAVMVVAGPVAEVIAQSPTSGPAVDTVRVAGIVLKWVPGDRSANYQRAEHLIREAASNGAQIVATPESFLDGYSVRDPSLTAEEIRALAEPIPDGVYFRRLQELADELDIHLIAALTERDEALVYNSAVLLGPDGALVGRYRKKFLWSGEARVPWRTG